MVILFEFRNPITVCFFRDPKCKVASKLSLVVLLVSEPSKTNRSLIWFWRLFRPISIFVAAIAGCLVALNPGDALEAKRKWLAVMLAVSLV